MNRFFILPLALTGYCGNSGADIFAPPLGNDRPARIEVAQTEYHLPYFTEQPSAKGPLSRLEFSVADYQPSPLNIRLALLEALRYRHWEVVSMERDRFVATYQQNSIEILITDDRLVAIQELPKKSGERFKPEWLDGLQKIVVDQLIHAQQVQRVKELFPAEGKE